MSAPGDVKHKKTLEIVRVANPTPEEWARLEQDRETAADRAPGFLTQNDVLTRHGAGDFDLFIIKGNGALVGSMAVEMITFSGVLTIYVRWMHVDRAWRRREISSLVLESWQEIRAAAGAEGLTVAGASNVGQLLRATGKQVTELSRQYWVRL